MVLPASPSVFQPAFVRQLSVLLAAPFVSRVQPAWLSALVALPLAFQLQEYQPCKDDTTADGYKALDFNIATGEGYISGFGYDEDHPDLFLCAEHNGASNLPVGDYYWNNNDGFRVAGLGGRWSNGAGCGAWYLNLGSASSYRYRDIGGRLLYVPQTKISA